MNLSCGIIIVGSLLWENGEIRQDWRDDYLDMDAKIRVCLPIRYGRRSIGRNNTYTMVYSRKAPLGEGYVVPCQQLIRSPKDLRKQAEALWTAERDNTSNGRIADNWGSVALLRNPESQVPDELLEDWAIRAAYDPDYGNIAQAPGEGQLVTPDGLLLLEWPKRLNGHDPLPLDILLGTATQPNAPTTRFYPEPEDIAREWLRDRRQGKDNERYFRFNRDNGVGTFQDQEIARLLADG